MGYIFMKGVLSFEKERSKMGNYLLSVISSLEFVSHSCISNYSKLLKSPI